MTKKDTGRKILGIALALCVLVEAVYEFLLHRKYIFVWDDGWYATNLVTGEPLASIADVIESQIWHFMNWGGRCINHGLLQIVLMNGELFADVLNMVVTFTLCYLICELAGKKNLIYYCISFFLLIGLNTDVKLSMFWQSGSVNYLYSTNWILLFLIVYMRQVKNPEAGRLKGIEFWMIPLGLITGWSNENMGPACFTTAIIVILYFVKGLKKKVPVWMWIGAFTSFCGSILVLVAPGNFVRNEYMSEAPFFEALYNRFFTMLMGGASYLYASFLFTLFFMLFYLKVGNKLQPFQIILMVTLILAFGAMALSPAFPNRAAFGMMVLCIVLIISFIHGIEKKDTGYGRYIFFFSLCMWAYGIYILKAAMLAPL